MEKQNNYSLIHIGLMVRYLSNIKNGSSAETILDGLSNLETSLNNSQFNVSLVSLKWLSQDILKKTDKTDVKQKIDDQIFLDFKKEIQSLENTIYAEAQTKTIHSIPTRRFNAEYLLETPEKLLKDSLFGKLSDMAKFDFSSSCRCISYGEGTASAFHILRATEDTLKQYYFKYKKTKRLAKPMWGPMTTELRAKKTKKPDETILSALDVVRISYRNPIQHPLIKYDIESAQDLLGVCIDLLNKMTKEL